MELFGSMPDMMKFIIVFLVILGVLVPLLWRRFSRPFGSSGQRGRRLAVLDTAVVDVRRRLVLIKRDNVEHLVMIGGPTDIVVESNIGRTPAAARDPRPIPDARPEAARQATAAEAPDWALPLEPMARPVRMVDLDAALPEPPARTAREAMVDSMRAVRSGAAARRGPTTDFENHPPEEIAAPSLTPSPGEVHQRPPQAPEPRRSAAAAPPEGQRSQPAPETVPQPAPPPSVEATEPKRERAATAAPGPATAAAPAAVPPSPRPAQPVPAAAASTAAVPPPKPTPSDESNLAEMAQRLEAALRRPTRSEPPPPPPVRPQPPAGRKVVKPDAAGPAKMSGKSPDAQPPDLKVLSGKGKSEPESLEDEMARMLGRPGKS